ncbi:pertactin-like passenger domain-containing protein, partial [uncultured Citrobacter sp.]|uniref:pertactin-like passenger domain-containing protein n=1 Tax=uncultured Citrobacter sp. TaxID=200446 RepID=UPI002597AE9F
MKIRSIHLLSAFICYIPITHSAIYSNEVIDKTFNIGDGDSISSSTITSSGVLNLTGTAKSNNIIVSDGGVLAINKGSIDTDSSINSGGEQSVAGLALNTKVYGTQRVSGQVENASIDGGYQIVYGVGNVINTEIINYGVQYLSGNSENTKILEGTQFVQNGGIANNTTLKGLGIQVVESGGIAKNTVLSGKSIQYVRSDQVTDTILNDYTSQFIEQGGVASSTTINSYGAQYIHKGGNAVNTTVNENGEIQVMGGTLDNAILNGGILNAETGEIKGEFKISDAQVKLGAGIVSEQANINLGANSNLTLNKSTTDNSYKLNNVELSGGAISFYNSPAVSSNGWNTLTLNDLSGRGNFYMHTDVAAGRSDLLNVTGTASGSFNLFVEDTGGSPTSADNLLLV